MEETNDIRLGDRRVAEPCVHERDWVRLEQRVDRHDEELKTLMGDGVGTKVYMKQIIESQQEVKDSIKALQEEIQKRPVQDPKNDNASWSDVARRMTPDVIKLVLVLAVIIAALVGADNLVTKLVGGTP